MIRANSNINSRKNQSMNAQNQYSDDWLDDFGEELEDRLDHHSAKNVKKFRDSQGDPVKKSGLRKENKPDRGKKDSDV